MVINKLQINQRQTLLTNHRYEKTHLPPSAMPKQFGFWTIYRAHKLTPF